jgi:AcrR family transcriptional regulator
MNPVGRPRGFDETTVIRSAAELFSTRSYDGISMDELVTHLGVHRNSLYKTFGSKRGLYQAALRWSLEHDIAPLIERVAGAKDLAEALRVAVAATGAEAGLNLLLLAAVERAPVSSPPYWPRSTRPPRRRPEGARTPIWRSRSPRRSSGSACGPVRAARAPSSIRPAPSWRSGSTTIPEHTRHKEQEHG